MNPRPVSLAAALFVAAASIQHAAPPETRYVLDESKLPAVNRFRAADLDASRSACADFAGHVNAKWLAANQIPGDRTTWGASEMLAERSLAIQKQLAEQSAARADVQGVEKIVGDLYATGLDEAKINAQGIKPLASRLAAIEALKDGAAVAEYVRQSYAKGENFLFDFGPESDFAAPDMVMAYAIQAGLGLPDKSYYVDADKKDKLQAYERHVAKVLVLSGIAAPDAEARARQVVAMETRLAAASKSSEEISRDVSLYYNPVTPAEADKLTPNFPWSRFLAAQGLPADQKFSLAMPAFHQEVSAMLQAAPVDHWKSYLRFHTVDSAAPFLSDPFADENFDFYAKTLRGQKEIRPRWKRVLDTVNNQAGEALGQLYVKVAFPPASKARMQELVQNLGVALKGRLENLAWMSPETKKKAIEKWAAFTPKIGYPDKWREWSGLRTSRTGYLDNVLAAAEFNYRYGLAKVGKPVDRAEWSLQPQTVNANYQPLRNEVTFPAAILQPPFFDPAADDAVNYGGIGAVIGHEMIHGYDDQGSRFSASGKFENWWSPEDAKGFAARGEKLIAQFDAYEVAPGKKVNGKLTLGENIADLGGLAVAHDAMMRAAAGQPDPMLEGMTRDQRFFANWATAWRRAYRPEEAAVRLVTDPHAPSMFRAVGTPSNMETFAKAFGCKAGDSMVRGGDARIDIW